MSAEVIAAVYLCILMVGSEKSGCLSRKKKRPLTGMSDVTIKRPCMANRLLVDARGPSSSVSVDEFAAEL